MKKTNRQEPASSVRFDRQRGWKRPFRLPFPLLLGCLLSMECRGYMTETVNGIEGKYTVTDNKATLRDDTESWGHTTIPKATAGAVTIPSTLGGYPVTAIGSYAFGGCQGLTAVTIPEGVTSLGNQSFCGCTALSSIAIPNSVTSADFAAFDSCSGLETVTVGTGLTTIASQMFCRCTKLTSVTLQGNVTEFEQSAFSCCSSLRSLTFPASLRYIGAEAFASCSSLQSVSIPAGVTSIGTRAFGSCGCLERIDVDAANATYSSADGALYDKRQTTILACPGGKTSIRVPNGVTSIGDEAFFYAAKLTSVELPETLTKITDYAFYGCSSLTSLAIPSGVTSIGRSAFYGCNSLTTVSIPATVTALDSTAFVSCDSLIALNVASGHPQYASIDGIMYDRGTNTIVCCPAGLSSVAILDGTVKIGEYAFYCCKKLTSVTIPDSVTSIGRNGFFKCTSLESVTLPNSITNIDNYSFTYCSKLASITLPSGLSRIGDEMFSDCGSLASLTIPASVTNIGSMAFYGCYCLRQYDFEGAPPAARNPHWDSSNALFRYNAWYADAWQTAISSFGLKKTAPYFPDFPNLTSADVEAWISNHLAVNYAKEGETAADYRSRFVERFGNDLIIALTRDNGKRSRAKDELKVWYDFVAGTDPLDESSVLTATIAMSDDGSPDIDWLPKWSESDAAKRTYQTWGKQRLSDAWGKVESGREADYRFFQVTVELKR